MSADRSSQAAWAVILLAVLLPLGGYVGSYFVLSDCVVRDEVKIRVFNRNWQVAVFTPMGKIESAVCWQDVFLKSIETRFQRVEDALLQME